MRGFPGILWAMVAALGGGCTGVNASRSVSPLDFLLPGLTQSGPSTPTSLDGPNATPLLTRTDPPPSTPIKPTPVAETGSIQ